MESLDQSLSDELLQMAKADQAMRLEVMNGAAEWASSVDEASQEKLMATVAAKGWPTIGMVGAEASQAAWLLVQHAPSLTFMEQCLEAMKQLPAESINPANIAYLEDRVLMMNGRPQLYGTQFQGKGKDMKAYRIEDVEHVDERRASVGLGTFAEDEAKIQELYRPRE